MKPLILSFFITSATFCLAQSNQAAYLEAKRQFSLSNHKAAMQAFQELSNDGFFGEYASFYYALSAYKMKQYSLALNMWKQIQTKYPKWDKREEVNFWIAQTYFKQKRWQDAFSKSESLSEGWRQYLIDASLGSASFDELNAAYALNKDNSYIGRFLFEAIKSQPSDDQDGILLEELSDKFDLEVEEIADLPLIKKDAYAVALVLPFMFESLETPQTVIKNSIIFDLYQGMSYAAEDLKSEGINLSLFPFDTKKKADVTRELIQQKKLDNADVIIGPLYGGPNRHVSQFSKENEINMINPLSSNEAVVDDNPFGFLFKPSYATQGKSAAKYAAKRFQKNKKVFVFYETDRDSLIASAYLEEIQREGFFVIKYERLTNEDALQIQRDFTEEYEVRLDTMYSEDQMDSIAEIPGRIVRTRSLRDEETGKLVKDDEGEDVIETYEVKFTVQPDSIGHIFAATSSNVMANNFISMIEVRNDSIGLIGYRNWLDFSLVTYTQLERLQVDFLSPSFYDPTSKSYETFGKRFLEEKSTDPSEFHVYGYELIMHLGRLMNEYGVYFQKGLIDTTMHPGVLMEGLNYGANKDNQVVPVTRLENLRLHNQNTLEKEK